MTPNPLPLNIHAPSAKHIAPCKNDADAAPITFYYGQGSMGQPASNDSQTFQTGEIKMKQYHVIAIPLLDEGMGEKSFVGLATDKAQAIHLCQEAGLVVVDDHEGGNIDQYDAEDAPGVYGFEADGLGAISVTVEA